MGLTLQRTWRGYTILALIFMGFCALAYRLVSLTVLQHSFLKHQGTIRSSRVVAIPAARGSIVDRHGAPLAVSLPAINVWINPKHTHWTRQQARRLAKQLGLRYATLHRKIHDPHKGFVYLQKKIATDQWQAIQKLKLRGLHAEHVYSRFYPMGPESAPLIGLTNAAGKGQEGLELAYDAWLQGQAGKQAIEKDRMGHVIAVKEVLSKPRIGQKLTLTIDRRLQSMAFEALKSGMQKVGAKQGSVVILAPKTGHVLAMVNWPSFNPNNLQHVQFSTIKNHAVTDLFEPGSTIKTFSMIHALASGHFNRHTVIDTGKKGALKVHGHWVRDEFLHHGVLSATDILKKSSNVGIAKMTLSLPAEGLPHLLEQVGFFHMLLGLPGEATGYVSQRLSIDPFELATLSFGYGMTASHLQLAHAYAVLANDGVDPGMYLVQGTKQTTPKRVFAQSVARDVQEMLRHVLDRAGTGYRARIPGVAVAGKTGTAHVAVGGQYAKNIYMASFVGMFPMPKPQYVVSVVLKQPNIDYYFGGLSAAPIFADIGAKMKRLGLTSKRALVS